MFLHGMYDTIYIYILSILSLCIYICMVCTSFVILYMWVVVDVTRAKCKDENQKNKIKA